MAWFVFSFWALLIIVSFPSFASFPQSFSPPVIHFPLLILNKSETVILQLTRKQRVVEIVSYCKSWRDGDRICKAFPVYWNWCNTYSTPQAVWSSSVAGSTTVCPCSVSCHSNTNKHWVFLEAFNKLNVSFCQKLDAKLDANYLFVKFLNTFKKLEKGNKAACKVNM